MTIVTASNPNSQVIPDPGTIVSSAQINNPIPTGATINWIAVGMNILHHFDEDIDIRMIAPDGSSINLSNDNGSNSDNYVTTIFFDTAATNIIDGSGPFNGFFRPEQPLSTLHPVAARGGFQTWKLQISDDFSDIFNDTGTLLNWSMDIDFTYSGVVQGTQGNDTFLSGSNGRDVMLGLAGNDFMNGWNGADFLRGGLGKDFLFGGGGTASDDFRYSSAAEAGFGATRDVIGDFQHLVDDFDLRLFDASRLVGGNNAFVFRGTGPLTTSAAGEIRIQKFDLPGNLNDFTLIIGDTDGDRAAEFQIQLGGLINLTKADFLL